MLIITEIHPTEPAEKPYLTNQPEETHENVVVTEAGDFLLSLLTLTHRTML
jgi:hypothetical protein